MNYKLIISNLISFLIGTLLMFIFVVYFYDSNFPKVYIDVIKFIILPIIVLIVGFYQWKKVLLNKEFAEHQFKAIVELINTITPIHIPIEINQKDYTRLLIFKFDRDLASNLDEVNMNQKIYLMGKNNYQENHYFKLQNSLDNIHKNPFLPLSISRVLNKLYISAYVEKTRDELPNEYISIGIEDGDKMLLPSSDFTLHELFKIKDELWKEIEVWLKNNSINEKLNIESNRHAKNKLIILLR